MRHLPLQHTRNNRNHVDRVAFMKGDVETTLGQPDTAHNGDQAQENENLEEGRSSAHVLSLFSFCVRLGAKPCAKKGQRTEIGHIGAEFSD